MTAKHDERNQRLIGLVDLCGAKAWRVAMSYLRDHDAAFDAVQQAFLVATRKSEAIPKSNPWPWFSVVVANEARNMRRKKRPTLLDTNDLEGQLSIKEEAIGRLINDESQGLLEAELARLPLEERDAIALTTLGGMTQRAAAEALGIPRKTLASRAERGLATLRIRLGRSEREIGKSLAAAPILLPAKGVESALAAWKASALKLATTLSTQSAIAGTGAVFMTKVATFALVTIALIAGIGGGLLGAPMLETSEKSTNTKLKGSAENANTAKHDANERDSGASDGNTSSVAKNIKDPSSAEQGDYVALMARFDEVQAKLKGMSDDFDSLRKERDALLEELSPMREAQREAYPTFTFGAGGKLDGVLQQNWKIYADAAKTVNDVLAKMKEARAAGEPVKDEWSIALQKNTERMRTYEYDVLGKLPSAAAQNRETTHPITISNMLAANLRAAGLPLDERQIKAIDRLGEDWDRSFETMRERYSPDTLQVRKVVDELRHKGKFGDDLMNLLTQAQRDVVVNPETWHVAGLDLYCPTLMILHSTPAIGRANSEELATVVKQMLVTGWNNGRVFSWNGAALDETQQKNAEALVADFLRRCEASMKPVDSGRVRNYTLQEALEFGEATVGLFDAMIGQLNLSDEQIKSVRETPMLIAPRIIKP